MTVSVEIAVLIGAIVGAIASLSTVFLTHWLSKRREYRLDDKRKERLILLLRGEKYKWRNIETLSSAVGADIIKTKELLLEIDARQSLSNNSSWGLISRNPFPEDIQPKE
ncbi:hypothetical protein [Parasphingorhabdus cellanae]|uniref:Uncharacterized protein n=1 Tax=Parasphingorhabdus cellanae TaxID=2806553 RepID=A0ABX7T074_9SPHN|nr:hypothetical protein [Parasphingorhabdus cellanae]QTD54551.1 hypothetical protein J4G78_09645 [Parasphingorhabdus cellanae]